MASYNKFNQFVEDLCKAKHDFSSHTLKLWLTAIAPNAADNVIDQSGTPGVLKATSNANEIAAGNGYSAGGTALTITGNTQSGGTYTLAANQVVYTASGGAITAFRYLVLHNSSGGTSSTRPVIAWWDYGSALTLNDGETLTVKFNNANPGTIFTLA